MKKEASDHGSGIRGLLLPKYPRKPPVPRPLQILVRTLHIVSMGMILGAIPFGGNAGNLRAWILAVVVSGILLLAIDLWKTCMCMVEGSGAGVILKLVLLGLGNLFPESRMGWYIAAAAVASFGSHMPSGWRHFSFIEWRVMEIKPKR